MKISTYGNIENEKILLIHPMFSDSNFFEGIIEKLKDRYFLIVPTLSGHDRKSTYISLSQEEKEIDDFLKNRNISKIKMLIGFSLGGNIAFDYFCKNSNRIDKVVVDSAPLFKFPKSIKNHFFKKYLKCEVISQYADEECGIIAQERIPTKEDGNVMYLNYADYYIEFLKLESDEPAEFGELARVVITDLHNHAFPIIRYDCGDTGVLMPSDEYSRGYPVLGKLYGRKMDMVYTTSGIPFSPMLLGRTVKNFNVIKQWQFIQKGERNYVLKTILEDGGDKDELVALIDELKCTIGVDSKISIEIVNEIPLLKSGKRKVVVNEWKK